MSFLHGIEIVEVTEGPRPVAAGRTNVIGLVGTAGQGALDTPILISASRKEGTDTFGAEGTIPPALDAILTQTGAQVVVVCAGRPSAQTVKVVDEPHTFGAGAAGEIDLGHENVSDVVVKSSYGNTTHASPADYTVDLATGIITNVAASGIADGADVLVSYDYDVPPAGAADVAAAAAEWLIGGESVVGQAPRILAAPGWSDQAAVSAALISAAERLRAIAVIEGPDTTDAAAITARDGYGSRRAYLVDPAVRVQVGDALVTRPNSAYVAGVIARSDAERGAWASPSNREILGVAGTNRPVDFHLTDPNSAANRLNEADVATIIRHQGHRLWGNRTCSADDRWAFLSVVRTADLINDALVRSHLWAVDRGITRTYLADVAEGVNNYLRSLVAQGAIVGGRCVPSPDLNAPAQIEAGKVTFDVDFTPAYPAEHITFRSRLTNEYLEDVA